MTAPAVLAELKDADPARRQAALDRLATVSGELDADLLAVLIDCLGAPHKSVQRRAADLIARIEASMRSEVVARLRRAGAGSDPALAWGATYALGRLGVAEPAMVGPLLEVLARRDGDERWAAAALLTRCARAHGADVIATILAAAGDIDSERRKMALYVLRDSAPCDPDVHAATRRGLGDPAVGVRFAALSTLQRLEPLPADACALVLRLLREDPEPGLRRAAMNALGVVGRGVSAATRAVAAAAVSDDPGLRRAASAARRRLEE